VSAALLRSRPDGSPLVATGPSVAIVPGDDQELSSRQKALVLMGLSLASWAVLLVVGYAGFHFLTA